MTGINLMEKKSRKGQSILCGLAFWLEFLQKFQKEQDYDIQVDLYHSSIHSFIFSGLYWKTV